MNIKILKFSKGDDCTIKYLQENESNGMIDFVERNDKYNYIPHDDLNKVLSELLHFYNSTVSKDHKEETKLNQLAIGRTIAKRVLKTWSEDFIDEDSGEVVSIERNEILIDSNEIVTREILEDLKARGKEKIYTYKQNYTPDNTTEGMYYDIKSIDIFHEKDGSSIKGFRLELYLKDNCPLQKENKCITKTSKISLNITYSSTFHIEIQQKFLELLNSLNFELLEYMKGKNGLPEQTTLF